MIEKQPLTPPSALQDFEKIKTPEGSLYASLGENYKNMIFGRDSLEVAHDLLKTEPETVLAIFDTLAQLQGTKFNDASAEEPGRIPHQHAQKVSNGLSVSENTATIIDTLSEKWGGDENGFTYYGSVDATALFASLGARYGKVYGKEFLNEPIKITGTGETISRKESLVRSLTWIANHLESSELSLIEFRRLNDQHIVIQSWRDSGSSFIHQDGSPPNLDGFIAAIEVQAYAYDALSLSSELLQDDSEYGYLTEVFDQYAEKLKDAIITNFWMPDSKSFAMGVDRDPEKWQPRQIKTPSSSQGMLLDSRLFIDMEDEERQYYVKNILTTLYSPDFITDVGMRCRGVSAADITGFADYHGTWAVWVKESYDFAKGLRRQGFDNLAEDIEKRILNFVNISGENYEFLYVNPAGEVDYRPKKYTPGMQVDEIIIGTNLPESSQAWTISAVQAIKRKLQPAHKADVRSWQGEVESQLQDSLPQAKLLKTEQEIHKFLKTQKTFAIDVKNGIEADKRWNPSWWS